MLKLLLFLLAVYGGANIVSVLKTRKIFEAIFGRIPLLGPLVRCPICVSFWIGMALSLWVISPSAQVIHERWKAVLLDSLAGLGFTFVFHVLYIMMDRLSGGFKEKSE